MSGSVRKRITALIGLGTPSKKRPALDIPVAAPSMGEQRVMMVSTTVAPTMTEALAASGQSRQRSPTRTSSNSSSGRKVTPWQHDEQELCSG